MTNIYVGQSPKVSVIIPCYNASQTIRHCLDSVVGQTYENIEIICVDDSSNDDTLKLLKTLEQNDDRIVVLHSSNNRGVFESRRIGFNASTGDYIVHVDSDDCISKTYIEGMVSSIGYGIDLVFSFVRINQGAPTEIEWRDGCSFKELLYESGGDNPIIHVVWGKMYKRAVMSAVFCNDCLSVNMCEDLLINVLASEFIKTFAKSNIGGYYQYNNNERSIVNEKTNATIISEHLEDLFKVFKYFHSDARASSLNLYYRRWRAKYYRIWAKKILRLRCGRTSKIKLRLKLLRFLFV